MAISGNQILTIWRISKKHPNIVLRMGFLNVFMAALAIILFIFVYNYHDGFETLGGLLRIPILVTIGIYAAGLTSLSALYFYRFFEVKKLKFDEE